MLRRLQFKTELSSLSFVIVTNVSSVLRRITLRSKLKAIFFCDTRTVLFCCGRLLCLALF